MNTAQLERCLKPVRDFDRPKVQLEQYMTPPDLAAEVLAAVARECQSPKDLSLLDLGCGSGMLSLASLLMGFPLVVAVDIDDEALKMVKASHSAVSFGKDLGFLEIILADASMLPRFLRVRLDIVLTNPPFGTKNNEGIDTLFVEAARKVCSRHIYSFHKLSTASFLTRKHEGTLLAKMNFQISNQFRFHHQAKKIIQVGLFKFKGTA
jgi:predicted RNA methylase